MQMSTPEIRKLLTDAFGSEQLEIFCYDHFRSVYETFAPGRTKLQMVQDLIEHCERRKEMDRLLALLQQERPEYFGQPAHGHMSSTAPPAVGLHIFLSYAPGDQAAARTLYQTLRQEGFRPWMKDEDLLPGQNWRLEISKQVRNSHVTIICLSPTAVARAGQFQREIRQVLDVADEQPEGAISVIPFMVEKCELPQVFLDRDIEPFKFFEDGTYDRLLRALRARAAEVAGT
jgi:hypothetical protein